MSGAGLLIDPAWPLAMAWRGDEFPDWPSPMLVRELRQAVWSVMLRWGFPGVHPARGLLPYFLLRYFFGGVDPLVDLVRYVLLLLGSMLMAAMAVAASTRTTRERFGFIVGGVLFFSWAARGMYSSLFIGPAATTSWLLVAMVMLVYVELVLEYGAAEIGPTAANHACRKRLSALVSRPWRRDLRGTCRLVAEASVA